VPPKSPNRALIDTPKIRPCRFQKLQEEYKSRWSRKRVLLLVSVGFDMYSAILRSYLILALMSTRSLLYVKDNDRKYGVIVSSHNPKTSKVIGLQCHFYITFSQEERSAPSTRPWLKCKDGLPLPITTILKTICSPNIEQSGWNMTWSIPIMSIINFSPMCLSYSRTQSKRIFFPSLWMNDRLSQP